MPDEHGTDRGCQLADGWVTSSYAVCSGWQLVPPSLNQAEHLPELACLARQVMRRHKASYQKHAPGVVYNIYI